VASNLHTRLVKLEASMLHETEPIRIAHFIVVPGNLHPVGYSCDGVEVVREPGESTAALMKRCHDAVPWELGNNKIFEPM
jgi:hypothetical protein